MFKKLFLFLITIYQKGISPYFPAVCKYYPTCSCYTKQAIKRYGVLLGIWKGFKRICRCNPFSSGGYDPLE